MDYFKEIQPWQMDNKPVSFSEGENNDHLCLIVSGIKEEENVELKLKIARAFSML